MQWMFNNWFLIAAALIAVVALGFNVYYFTKLPSDKQKAKVIEWLVWACIEAEKKLQSDTGQMKLREVYNKFCSNPVFEWTAKIITFDLFSEWVKEALVTAKQMLADNDHLAEYVYGENAKEAVEKINYQLNHSGGEFNERNRY